MLRCFKKASALALIITLLYSQNLYAFNQAFVLPSAPPIKDLYPNKTQIIGLSLSAIQGGLISNPGTALETAFANIKPDLFNSLAFYGMQKLGEFAGLSPALASLIGSPIAGALSGALQGAANIGQNIVQGISDGLAHGVVKYGVDFIGDSHPILGSLLAPALQRTIESALGHSGLFQGMGSFLQRAALNTFNVVGGTVRTVFQGVGNFTSLIQQKGLAGAFESLGSSAFSRSAQESIVQQGGLQNVLNSTPRLSVELSNGTFAQELKINDRNSLFFSEESRLIGRKDEGFYQLGEFGYDSLGKLNFSLLEGEAYGHTPDNLDFHAGVRDGQLFSFRFEAPDQDVPLLEVTAVDPEKPILAFIPVPQENPNPDPAPNPSPTPDLIPYSFWNAALNLNSLGVSLFLNEGVANAAEVAVSGSVESLRNIKYIFGNGFNNEVVPEGTRDGLIQPLINLLGFKDKVISFIQSVNISMYETTNLIGNALNWISNFYTQAIPNENIKNFIYALNAPSDFFEDLVQGLIPQGDVPEEFSYWTQKLQTWYHSMIDPYTNHLVDEVIQKLTAVGTIKDAIAFSHSGFFAPLLGAIERMDYDIHTLINYEGPYLNPNDNLQSTHLKRIINIWGTADNSVATGQYTEYATPQNFGVVLKDFDKKAVSIGDFGPPFVMDDDRLANFTSVSGIKNINIKIVGARHNDFSYKEYKTDQNGNELSHTFENELWNRDPYEPEQIAREINFKTNKFMRNLYRASLDEEAHPGALREFLRTTAGATEDDVSEVWTVEARQLTYELEYSYI